MKIPVGDVTYYVAFTQSEYGKISSTIIAADDKFFNVVSVGVAVKSVKDKCDRAKGREISFSHAMTNVHMDKITRTRFWDRYHEVYPYKSQHSDKKTQ